MKFASSTVSSILFFTAASRRRFHSASAFTVHKSFSELIHRYDAFILDQFGVMHDGVNALDGAVHCVRELYENGKTLIILSNTSAPSQAALQKLPKFGFDETHFLGAVTSGEEASKYIRKTFGSQSSSPSKALFLTWDASDVDNPRLTATPQRFLQECGHVQVASTIEEADLLLLHGSEVWYRGDFLSQQSLKRFIEEGDLVDLEPILQACIDRSLPCVCANPDFVVQTPEGGQAHMPGKIAARYQELGGHTTLFGKPQKEQFLACIDRLGLDKNRVAHVGDSLHHDIAGAYQAGIPSVFVTSGIHANQFGTSFGELPSMELIEKVVTEAGLAVPTHVVSAFRI
jgi:HAD superfamily hydrolase (TIGR01459 family)